MRLVASAGALGAMACALIAVPVPALAGDPVRALGDRDYPPIAYLEDGVPRGFDVDVLKALGEVLGWDLRVELLPWDLAQQRVLEGKAELLTGMSISPERKALWDFATPTVDHAFSLFVTTQQTAILGTGDLRGKRVGVTPGGYPRTLLKSKPGIELVLVTDYKEGFDRLKAGSVDAVAADTWVGGYVINKHRITGVAIAGEPFGTLAGALAVPKGNEALLREINRGLALLGERGAIDDIRRTWEPKRVVFLLREQVTSFFAVAAGVIALILLAGLTAWSISLRKENRIRRQAEARIRRLTRVYAVLSGINVAIVRIADRDRLFAEACRVAIEDGEFRMVWLGLLDAESSRLRPAAWAGDVRDYLDRAPLAVVEAKPEGLGLAGQAIRAMSPVVSNDARNDPRIMTKTELEQRGINSLAVIPLVVGERAVGALALYAADTGFFDDEEMRLLTELAGDISFALDHIEKGEKVRHLAYFDPLTGIANRTLFLDRLTQYVSTAARENQQLALVIINIERFKTINDTFGRQAGDALLKQVAERLLEVIRDPNRVARIGADHFAVIAPHVLSLEALIRNGELAQQRVDGAAYAVGGAELRISTQAGVALFPEDGTDAETLFRNAEAALRKVSSGERYVFYARHMTERIAERLTLENKLRLALERDEFVLHYQPKVDAQTRRIVALEALIRWQSPELGLVPPLHFIPLMEETGLILQVGAWALKRASLDHRRLAERGPDAPRIAVNVSPIQLRRRDFVDTLKQALADGAAPAGIDLEITETLVMEDIDTSIKKLTAVRALGVGIAIDDFGTGYSSLAYLARLPVQSLKIDRSFTAAMLDDRDTMAVVSTIISLARSLQLRVVAEGVESEEQAIVLRRLRCDEMQGYLFSAAVPFDAIAALLAKRAGARAGPVRARPPVRPGTGARRASGS